MKPELKISNTDFWILAGILSTIGGIGIFEGNSLHPSFYAHPVIIIGGLGYIAYKAFYLDRKNENTSTSFSANSGQSHSE